MENANPNLLSSNSFRNNKSLSKAIMIFVAFVILLDIIAVFSGLMEISLVSQAKEGVQISQTAADGNDARQGIIGIFQMVLTLVFFILFLVWVNRSNKNLAPLGVSYKQFSSGWAVGWFFVPIANIYKPYRVVSEIWDSCSSIRVSVNGVNFTQKTPGGIVGLWWGMWLLSNFAGQLAFRLTMRAGTMNTIYAASVVSVISDITSIISEFASAYLVYKITSLQIEKHNSLQTSEQPEGIPNAN
ncbi:MAG: DUF4328 domain-containing protein [Clostridia bacterium]|nr:DUF4328 domain-containing protein [Clostridia bacterium]